MRAKSPPVTGRERRRKRKKKKGREFITINANERVPPHNGLSLSALKSDANQVKPPRRSVNTTRRCMLDGQTKGADTIIIPSEKGEGKSSGIDVEHKGFAV